MKIDPISKKEMIEECGREVDAGEFYSLLSDKWSEICISKVKPEDRKAYGHLGPCHYFDDDDVRDMTAELLNSYPIDYRNILEKFISAVAGTNKKQSKTKSKNNRKANAPERKIIEDGNIKADELLIMHNAMRRKSGKNDLHLAGALHAFNYFYMFEDLANLSALNHPFISMDKLAGEVVSGKVAIGSPYEKAQLFWARIKTNNISYTPDSYEEAILPKSEAKN